MAKAKKFEVKTEAVKEIVQENKDLEEGKKTYVFKQNVQIGDKMYKVNEKVALDEVEYQKFKTFVFEHQRHNGTPCMTCPQ